MHLISTVMIPPDFVLFIACPIDHANIINIQNPLHITYVFFSIIIHLTLILDLTLISIWVNLFVYYLRLSAALIHKVHFMKIAHC